MSPRILQICPHDTPPFDDVCVRYMEAGAAIGAEVTSVFLGAAADQPLQRAHYLNVNDLQNTGALRQALQTYSEQNWDLVLCHRYRAYWSAARTRLAQSPCVVLAHEFGLLERWQRRLNRRVFASQFSFAGVSQPVADELAAVVGFASVLPNVLNVEAAQAALLTRAQARAQLELPEDAFVVGVVGRLHYKKRPRLALEAFELFQRQVPDAHLVFLGDGDRSGLAAQGNVHIAGFVPHAARYMGAFDLLLHTARVESFGLVVLEALLAGVPVVAMASAGPGYVLGELGVFAEEDTAQGFASALQRAAIIDRSNFAEQAFVRVSERFSVPALGQALQGLL